MKKTYDMTIDQIHEVVMESVKRIIFENKDFLYGINPEGRFGIGYEQSIENADLRINNAGTIHVLKCTKAGNVYTAVDDNDHRISIPVDRVEELLDGKQIPASLESGEDEYEVYVSIAHPSPYNKVQKYLDDVATDQEHPIFGNSKLD